MKITTSFNPIKKGKSRGIDHNQSDLVWNRALFAVSFTISFELVKNYIITAIAVKILTDTEETYALKMKAR